MRFFLCLALLTASVTPAVAQTRPLSLQDALALALVSNVSVRQKQADADAAAASGRAAQAQQKVSVSTTTYATAGDSSNILTTSPGVTPQNLFLVPPRGFVDQDLMVMAPLFTGGTLASRAASGRLLGAAAAADTGETRLSVAADVTQAYADAALQTSLVNVAGSRLTAEDEQVRITGERVKVGRLAPVDLLREQAAQAEAQQGALAATNNQALALVRLKSLLGLPQSSDLTLSETLDGLSAQNLTLPGTLNDALKMADARRPELQAARQRRDAAQADRQAAHGESAPQVYAVGMADAMAGAGSSGRVGFTVGVTASLPLYDGGQRRADVGGAEARLRRAEADRDGMRQAVEQETATAWLNWQTATAQIGAANAGVAAAQQGYTLADLRYNAGKSLTSERLDALAALGRAQGAVAQAKADVVTARARLLAAIGGSPAR